MEQQRQLLLEKNDLQFKDVDVYLANQLILDKISFSIEHN